MSSIPILQIQIDSARPITCPKSICLFLGLSNFESLIPFSTNSETDFLLTLIPATIIGPNKDPLPASSTPQIMFLPLLSVNSNPLQLKSIFVAFYPYPLEDEDILGAKSYGISTRIES